MRVSEPEKKDDDELIRLMHRDDLPMDVAEAVEQAKQMFPGFEVRFAGDEPPESLPPQIKEWQEHMRQSLVEGRCVDCGVQMENWADLEKEDWQPPNGWCSFHEGPDDQIAGWQCPACDAREEKEAKDLDV